MLKIVIRRKVLREKLEKISLARFNAGDLPFLIRLFSPNHGCELQEEELEIFEKRVEELSR